MSDLIVVFLFYFQEHKKHVVAEQEEASVIKDAVHASRASREPGPPGKKKRSKDRTDVLGGKRILCLGVARGLAPPGAYMYETTDGKRMRVFYGRRRRSTSSMIHIGRALFILHCLRWAWNVYQTEPGGSQCPYDLSKIKTS